MNGGTSSELNMLIKAKVVKLKVLLDIKGSNLPTQVNAITKALAHKPVKLSVKLDMTSTALTKQFRDINKKVMTNTAFKPVKIKIELDEKNGKSIKTELDKVIKSIRNFNNTYSKLVKETTENQKKLKQSTDLGGNVPTNSKVGNFNNIKQYNKVLEETRRIMSSKMPKGENGLFSSSQVKDAQGNLRGFVASMQKANGVIERIRYDWDTKKNQFTLIDRKVMTNTEAMIHKASQSLRDMERELGKTGKASREMTQEYKRLEQAGKDGTLNNDMVRAYQTRIKNAVQEQKVITQTNAIRREEAKIIREIKNLTANTGKAFADQSKALMSKARSAKDLEVMKDLRVELLHLGDAVKKHKDIEKDSLSVTKQKEVAQKKLTKFMRETAETNGALARSEIKATQELLKRAKTSTDMIAIQKRLNEMSKSQDGIKDKEKQRLALERLEKAMLSYAKVAGYSADTISRKFQMSAMKAGKNLASIEKEITYYSSKIAKANNQVAKSQLDLANNSLVKGVSNKKVRSLVDTGDVTKIKDYLAQTLKLDIATAKLSTNAKGVSTITTTLASTGKTAKQVTYQIDQLSNSLRMMGSQEVFNRNANLGLFEQLRVAMARVPIWMTAMTAFYGSIRLVKSVASEIMELDKALTEIKRVASDNINIDTMFKGSVELSKELGNNVHDILASVGELSRTFGDMNERQLLAITRTGTLMANVSDLNAEEAVQSLVGTMNAFNIEAEESIRIVDSLNEVDNNFAISTKQLSEGLSKSASTAKTFGVSMEESVGHITAIGSVTMESGRLIGNSLKTIYSRITTLAKAEAVLAEVGVDVNKTFEDGTTAVRPVNDILTELAGRWHDISDEQRQSIGVNVAGRYQLSRFLALMNNYNTALDATNTAVFSQGSAMRENAEYMKSFEARVSQMKNGWIELADAIGNTIMKSAMMEIIRLFTNLAQVAVKVVDGIGVLPVLFGAIVAVLLKMGMFAGLRASITTAMTGISVAFISTNTQASMLSRGFATLRTSGQMSMTSLGVSARAMATAVSTAFARASTAVRTFSLAFQGMLASTVIGVAFIGLGVAIEKLMKAYNAKKEKETELIKLNKKMVDSYQAHRDSMASVIERHQELRENTNRSAEEEREYLGIQKQLAEQLPTTVSYIDANGKAHLKTTDQINKEVEAVKQLSIQEAKLTEAKFFDNMEKKSKSYLKIVDSIDRLNEKQKRLEDNDGKNPWLNGNAGQDNMNLFKSKIDNTVEIEKNKVEVMMAEADKTGAIQKTIQAVQKQAQAYFEAGSKMEAMGDAQQSVVEAFIGQNEALLRNANTPKEFEQAYKDLFEVGVKVGDVFVEAYDIMSKGIEDPLELQALQKNLGDVAKSVPETFMMLNDEFGKPIRSIEEVEEGLREIVNVSQHVAGGAGRDQWGILEERLKDVGLTADQAKIFLRDLGNEHDNAGFKAEALAQNIDGASESLEGMNETAMEAIDLTASLFGYGKTELEGIKTHIQLMHLMVDQYGEAGKANDKYIDSQQAVAQFLNVTTEEVEKNKDKYYELATALTEIDWSGFTPDMSMDKYIDSQDISDTSKVLIKEWGGLNDFLTGAKIEIIENNEDVAVAVKETGDVFEKKIDTEKGIVGAVKEVKKETKDTSWIDALVKGWKTFDNFEIGTPKFLQSDKEGSWLKILNDWGDDVTELFTNLPARIKTSIADFGKVIEDFSSPDSSVTWMRGFNKWGDDMTKWFSDVPQAMKNGFSKWSDTINDFVSGDDSINWSSSLDGWWTNISNWIGEHSPKWGTELNAWRLEVVGWMEDMPTDITVGLGTWWDSMLLWFDGMPEKITGQLVLWGKAFDNFLEEQDRLNIEAYGKWGESISDFFGEEGQFQKGIDKWKTSISNFFGEDGSVHSGLTGWGQSLDTFFAEGGGLDKGIEKWSKTIGSFFGEEGKLRKGLTDWGKGIDEFFADGGKFKEGLDNWTEKVTGFFGTDKTLHSGLKGWGESVSDFFKNDGKVFLITNWSDMIRDFFSKDVELSSGLTGWLDVLNAWFTDTGNSEEAKGAGKGLIGKIKEGVKENEDDILETVAEIILDIPSYVIKASGILLLALGREIIQRIIKGAEESETQNKWSKTWSNLGETILRVMSPFGGALFTLGKKLGSDMGKGVKTEESSFGDRFSAYRKVASTAVRLMIKDILADVGTLGSRMGKSVAKGAVHVAVGMATVINSMQRIAENGLNSVRDGVNSVLGYMGVSPIGKRVSFNRVGTSSTAGSSQKESKNGMGRQEYAKGTKNGTHKGGEALVGEEGYELAHVPNKGLTLLGKHGAEILNLPRGTSVLPHAQTKEMLDTYNFPAYATGVGDYFNQSLGAGKNLGGQALGAGKKVLGKGKDVLNKAMDYGESKLSSAKQSLGTMAELFVKYIDKPSMIGKTVLNAIPNPNTFTGGMPKGLVDGAFKTVKNKGIEFLTDKVKNMFSFGGGADGGQGVASFGGLRKTSNFGYRMHPIYKTMKLHAGDDYAGAMNTAIKAQVGGVVTRSGASGTGWGTMVSIKNGIYDYIYAHLNKAIAKVGQPVGKGSMIGLLGSTGASTGPHLHYEVHRNGKAIKPNVLKGYATGGKISKEQVIRVGEGDKEEMIIPLEQHKDRAVGLWKEAGERLGQFEYFAKGGKVGKASTSSKSPSSSYTVKSGDTLGKIAISFNTTIKKLMELNKNISNANKISKGQKIKVGSLKASSTSTGQSGAMSSLPSVTNEQQVSKWQHAITMAEHSMKNIALYTGAYRDKMRDVISFEKSSLVYQKRLLQQTENRQKAIQKEVSRIPKNKRTEKQTESYTNLTSEYAQNITNIQNLKGEIKGLENTIKESVLAVFTNYVDGIMSTAEKRLKGFQKNISALDFRIDVTKITDPDNHKKIAELEAQRVVQAKAKSKESKAILDETQRSYNNTVKQYGVNSNQARRWKEELEAVTSEYQSIAIEALEAEKAIKDSRGADADKAIDQLKDYYGKMSDLAVETIEAEKKELEKAHDAKMKLYDKEAEKINSVYDKKLNKMDEEKSESQYLNGINEKNAKKAELLNKISVLSRDTSLEGRKKLAELESELAEVNEDISTTQKDRQDELLRDSLEAQKQAQLDAIEKKKEIAENELQFGKDGKDNGIGGLTGLDAQKAETEKYYSNLINNERYWADIRKGYIDGSNKELNGLLGNMYKIVKALNKGDYSGVKGFSDLSKESQTTIKKDNKVDVGNMNYKNEEMNKEISGNQSAKVNTVVKKGRLLTGFYKKKQRAEEIKNVFKNDYGSTNIKLVADKKSGGWKVQGDFASTHRATEVKDHLIARKLLSFGTVSSFDTGGYTGDWGKQGKLAVLHEKELVLNKNQTRDILDTSKIMERISGFIPSIKRSSTSDKLAVAGGTNISNNYELTLNIGSLNGGKTDADNIATTVMKGLKKMGR